MTGASRYAVVTAQQLADNAFDRSTYDETSKRMQPVALSAAMLLGGHTPYMRGAYEIGLAVDEVLSALGMPCNRG